MMGSIRYHIEKDFSRKNPITIDQVKQLSVEILREFVDFCGKNELRFFLAGGTLMGALRHQGFVPWDDDIDVTMPRKDYDQFLELVSDGKLGDYEVRTIETHPENHCRPFCRIVNTGYMCELVIDQMFSPPWIDILPWDGLPEDEDERKKHWDKVSKYKKNSRRARQDVRQATLPKNKCLKRYIKVLAKYVLYAPYRFIGPVYYAKKIIQLARKYDFETCDTVATFVAGYGRKETMPKKWFIDEAVGDRYAWFEGIKCPIPAHYHLVLKHMYGNYMKLPAVKKRIIHMKKAWDISEAINGMEEECV